MRVNVQDIPAAGFDRVIRLEDAWAVSALTACVEGEVVALAGHVRLERKHERVAAQVTVQLAVARRCERCDEPSWVSLDASESLTYLPIPEADEAVDGERELSAKELDVGWYEDGALELADLLSEVVALSMPPRVVCEDEAGCDARTAALLEARGSAGESHSPFAALGSLLR